MSGTKAGGKKAAARNKELHGENFYAEIGRKGGHNGHTGGFYGNSKRASEAGKIGGTISRRTGIKNGEGKVHRRNLEFIAFDNDKLN